MSPKIILPVLAIGAVVGYAIWLWWQDSPKQEEQRAEEEHQGLWHRSMHRDAAYSNPSNNHDHLKYKHSTRQEAVNEMQRMKQSAYYEETERLNVYYNRELNGWYIGRSNRF